MTIPQWLKSNRALSGRYLSLAIGLGTLGGFLSIAQAWFLARVVNAVVFEQAALVDVSPWLWWMLGIFVLRAALARAAEQTAFEAAARVKVRLRNRLYRHLQALEPLYAGHQGTGDLVNSLVDGIEALEAYYARYLPAMSLMALVPLSILAFVFPMDWLSGLIMLVTAPLIPFFMILIGTGAEKMNQRQWRTLARLSAHFLDIVQGLTSLKLFNASRREAQVMARISEDYRRSTMAVLRIAFLSSLVLEFFATVSIALVAVAIGFRLLWGEMGFFAGFFVLLLAPELYLPLRNMGTHYHARMDAIGAAERILELLETPLPERTGAGLAAPPLARTPIRLENVHFAYPGRRIALRGVDFEIHPQERLALVGPSGSGKSTLVNLLLDFIVPNEGRILVAGQRLRDLDPETWRRQLAWVPQRPRLFHGTVLDNIRLGRPDADMEAVRRAAHLALADDFIDGLSQGYQTPVGEQGQGLSGGQIQRIALARAFLKDAPLAILDEATANLDPGSEALVQQGIDNLAQGRTLLLLAHRLVTVRRSDRILVLDQGRVVEQGRHQQLMDQGGLYRRMVLAYEGTP